MLLETKDICRKYFSADIAIPNKTAWTEKAKLLISSFLLIFHNLVYTVTIMKLQITQGQLIYTSGYDISRPTSVHQRKKPHPIPKKHPPQYFFTRMKFIFLIKYKNKKIIKKKRTQTQPNPNHTPTHTHTPTNTKTQHKTFGPVNQLKAYNASQNVRFPSYHTCI